MPQLHLYIPDSVADEVKRRAKAAGMSTSRYLAEIVTREVASEWPERFFVDVVGGWQGTPLQRAPQGDPESRETLHFTEGN